MAKRLTEDVADMGWHTLNKAPIFMEYYEACQRGAFEFMQPSPDMCGSQLCGRAFNQPVVYPHTPGEPR
ncbi:hypothetical protein RU03_26300 [Pseudomonas simiae]|jgi:hypothetical protein|nr:hypothetical protein RU03_26300 [Pseudomonas simiae]